ncbi:MAG TPA: RNA-binding protein [Erysipelotrichaceae bacterium]|nr:KH domain-containing protein [Solobacterium sp.]HAE17246.1 RNA-binding protein [Erysipelotrichaceae bacterium]
MAELDKVLLNLVEPMVEDREHLEVTEMPGDNDREVLLRVRAKDEDIARLIGRKGMMASALRQVMAVASHTENKRVSITFEQI